MKKFLVVYFSALLTFVLLFGSIAGTSAATVYKSEGFSFTEIDDSHISICGWDNRSADLVIPESLLESRVSEIDARAFMNNEVIKTVDFNSAYYLNKIGNMAFKGCTSLEGTVYVPGSVLSVGTGAFQECPLIESMYFYSAIADVPSQMCYKCSSLQNAIISDGVQSIGSYAFADCTSLTKVRIPDSVSIINDTAFNNCPDLVIHCYTDSYAHQYAVSKNIPYVLLDAVVPTEPPTTPATEPPTEPKKYLLGDSDTDGYITILDATTIQRVLADYDAKSFDEKAANVTGEGLNIVDATLIQRYLAEIPIPYAVGEWFTYDA